MEGFAERARRELLATGETVRKWGTPAEEVLTPQETQLASPRTAEYPPGRGVHEAGITSRRQLRAALDRRAPAPN